MECITKIGYKSEKEKEKEKENQYNLKFIVINSIKTSEN